MKEIQIFSGFSHVILEVFIAFLPLVIMFLIFQFWLLKFPKYKVLNIFKGLVLTFIGLVIFLQGVYVSFFPVGKTIGVALGSLEHNWVLIPIGFILGFVATFAEPAVRVLTYEVEKASGGYIPKQIMLYTLSLGVAISISLAMGRIIYGIPLWYFIIPGYLTAFIIMHYSTPEFIAIAFDSGGVATGPMTVTFISAVALGVASVIEGRNPLIEGFGMISLVALSPILTVLLLGLLFTRKESKDE
ncbi:DUF1538 domain-containing protein [Carboxydothermus hydrogenoformans]|uniref:Putative membrane protein n=1 Tax=Carboxydothermus hydrogenoformans (strain ATCC BAA-161 / DSM 6008 / Z-2901) TaxID=246194 RepID=Q3ACU6_CARHZ|nr:DUF1538 domain-containing protein [Carboxydothermus hydrogenoformans]ABB15382.1 putative membrane protein [Carboxydothermus hydrogenoformans Z-2901]